VAIVKTARGVVVADVLIGITKNNEQPNNLPRPLTSDFWQVPTIDQ